MNKSEPRDDKKSNAALGEREHQLVIEVDSRDD